MYDIHNMAFANQRPGLSGSIRTFPEDFIVDEQFSFTFDGEGEHVLLHIQKKNTNTEWLAKQIVKLASVRKMDVSYAGLKDRNAMTTQWFSVWLPGKQGPDWSVLNDENIRLLEVTRHSRKLRRGSLRGNRFKIIVRDIAGDATDLASRIENIRKIGVPNYFGEQRFGHNGMNLEKAEAMFNGVRIKDRFKRSMYLSAARSLIFNQLLSMRVENNNWYTALPGDVMLLDNSHSYFIIDQVDDVIRQRLTEHDIHPSGCLWGEGRLLSQGEVNDMELSLKETFPLFSHGLEEKGLKQERRALRLSVNDLKYDYNENNKMLTLSFYLPAGGYATAVLREMVDIKTPGNDND